jgi:dihydroorotase
MYDLLLKHGRLLDPSQGWDAERDIAFHHGRIAAVADDIPASAANQTIDVTGHLVTPGLIDLHVHVFTGVSHYGVDVDPHCLARGVTTALDAGSSGAMTFPGFRRFIIDVCQTRLLALLNISCVGMVTGAETEPPFGELEDLRLLHPGAAVRTIEANRDVILGVKVRLSDNLAAGGRNEAAGLHLAREAAEAVGLPLMVHTPKSSLSLEHILKELRPGDVLTHCFHGHRCGILGPDGQILPAVRAAMDRGILLDVGHGKGSFSWGVARTALAQGVMPNTISSDLHHYNLRGPVFDLATTLSKFLHLEVPLDEAFRRVTATPARFLKMESVIGTLMVGACADCAVFRLVEGRRPLTDTMGVTEMGRRWLEPRLVVRAGRVVAQYDDAALQQMYPDVDYRVVATLA